jgi:cytochrome P450 family 138
MEGMMTAGLDRSPQLSSTPRLPPGPRLPGVVQGLGMLLARRQLTEYLQRRYGPACSLFIGPIGQAVLVSDPALIRQVFMASTDVLGNAEVNLGRVLGPGSVFALDGDAHRQRRRVLTPPFRGQRMRAYQDIIVAETEREIENWPQATEFATLHSFERITLNIILRAVFGADGAQFDHLRVLLPRLVSMGSWLMLLPNTPIDRWRHSPWARFRRLRSEYDAVVRDLIGLALADPGLAERDDVLAMLLCSSTEIGEPMAHQDIADELLTLLTAGHETTANTLSWAVERLRRHPQVLTRLQQEADDGGQDLMLATLQEVQRTRPVILFASRMVVGDSMQLGEWTLPHGCNVVVGLHLVQNDEAVFPGADRFDPDRFVTATPDRTSLVPFGGGTRRCPGASFATVEMSVVLRTILQRYRITPTQAPAERWRARGVAFAPARGGRLAVTRR